MPRLTRRPFAAQARRLCPETDEHHARVWFCQTCRLIEMRLTPITDVLGDLLDDPALKLTLRREVRNGRIVYVSTTDRNVIGERKQR